MKHYIHYAVFLLLTISLLIMSLAVSTPVAKAQGEIEKLRSSLTIEPLEPQPVGSQIAVEVSLVNEKGRGIPNKVLNLYINDEQVRRARTDENGLATISIGRDWPIGEYKLRVAFDGTEAYLQASDNIVFTVRPVRLVIETVPPLPDVRFVLGDQTYVTQADGLVQIELDQVGTYHLEVQPPKTDTAQTDSRIAFERWADSVFTPKREVIVTRDKRLQAGFVLSHPVTQTFVDLNGDPVDEARISTLTLKSSFGTKHTFDDGQAHWLQANRISRASNGLEVAPAQYSVESVIIDEANVVNKYQQRFFIKPNDNWELVLLLYYANIRAKDAIFGFPLGTGVNLEYPDGRIESLTFGGDDEIRVGPLARGNYKLQVTGARGIAPPTPIALSRDQNVELKVLSIFDMGVGLVLGALLGFGLLFYGRPQLAIIPIKTVSGWVKPAFPKSGIAPIVGDTGQNAVPSNTRAAATRSPGNAVDAELSG